MPISEFEFIQKLKQKLPNQISNGIGDDCAYVYRDGVYELFSTDCMVEGVHFKLDDCDPYWVGWKLMAVNVSDIAAMGGDPKGALFSIAIPIGFKSEILDGIINGIADCAKKFNVSVMGGDTSKSLRDLFLNIAIWGQMKSKPILRSDAKEGDLIFVTGALGGSILGRHLKVQPRLKEMQVLSKLGIHAAIDISDGLLGDLGHIAHESHLSFVINAESVPIHEDAQKLAKNSKKSPLEHALTDGEDFEIAFTCSVDKKEEVLKLRNVLSDLTLIGNMITASTNRIIKSDGTNLIIKGEAFEHRF